MAICWSTKSCGTWSGGDSFYDRADSYECEELSDVDGGGG